MHRSLIAASVLVMVAAPAFAGSPKVGEVAPDFGSAEWVLNEPEVAAVSALRGEVIFVEKWGVKCPPCLALIPHVQKLHEEFGDKGLHIFAFEAQNHTKDEIRACVEKHHGKTYPVAANGASNYATDGGIPHGWIIGVDGKVIWEGNPGDSRFDQTLRAELAKVRFPGLGRLDLDKSLLKAASRFLKKDMGGARADAKKVIEDGKASEQAKADAQHVIDRIAAIGAAKQAKAEALEQEKRYLAAQEMYTWITRAFAKEDEAVAADIRLKEMDKDAEIKRELQAAQSLQKLLAQLDGKPAEVRVAALTKFAKGKHVDGTRAKMEAEALIQ